jgi:hypothetical protein
MCNRCAARLKLSSSATRYAVSAPGRSSVDLAGPSTLDLQAGTTAPTVVAALAAARELPQLSLEDALELTPMAAERELEEHAKRVEFRVLSRRGALDP